MKKKTRKGEEGIALIYLIIIIAIIIAMGVVAIILITQKFNTIENTGIEKNKPQNNVATNSGVKASVPEKVLYQPSQYKQTYIDKNGKVYNLDEIIDGKILNIDFSYGTGVVEKDGKYAIMDYTGKIIVDYGEYDYIADLGMNYVVSDKNGNSILLDINGNVIDGISYDRISGSGGIYTSWGKDMRVGMFTCSGAIIAEPQLEKIDKSGSGTNENNIFQRINNDWYVINKKNYDVKFKISGANIAQDYYFTNSLIDLDKNIIYVFDDEGNYVKLTDCVIRESSYWEQDKSYYTGLNIINKLSEYGYVIYECADDKYGIIYKDGNILTKEINGTSPEQFYYIGENYIFVQVGSNIEVYNGSKKVATLENKNIMPENELLDYFKIGSEKIIPIQNNDDNSVCLYNEKGELVNDKKYEMPYWTTILKTIDGSNKIKLTQDGKFLNANEFTDIELLYNEELGEYANNYFVGIVEMPIDDIRTEKKDYLINAESEKLFEISGTTFTTIYEKDNILIYSKDHYDDMYRVYDLKNNIEILALENPIEYISDYKIFISNSNIYSLTGQLIGSY